MSNDGPIHAKAQIASGELGTRLSPVLIDALTEACIVPAFRDWRDAKVKSLEEVEAVLEAKVKTWLTSEDAQKSLRPIIDDWFAELQREIEKETDPLCRDHGLPAMVLSLDDSQHVSQYLDGMSVAAPQVGSLESDTALAGTTISMVIIGALLAHANLLAPLLANPIGLVAGGIMAGGGSCLGVKLWRGNFEGRMSPKWREKYSPMGVSVAPRASNGTI